MVKYSFLFAPINGIGHLNASIGIAEQLGSRGHHVVFAIPTYWKGKVAKLGFSEELYEAEETPANPDTAIDTWNQMVSQLSQLMPMTPLEQHQKFNLEMYRVIVDQLKHQHAQLKEIVASVKPDVIVADYTLRVPALMDQGIPWVLVASVSPLGISEENCPPAFTGYAADGNQEAWKKHREALKLIYKDFYTQYNHWVVDNGGPDLEFNYPIMLHDSPWANIYMYPRELDYTSLRPTPQNWHHFDAFVRGTEEAFEVPDTMKVGKGKLVYFSMGTIGSGDLEMMKRLVGILRKSPNRFLMSKGSRGDELKLSENMWGLNSVPQTKVIPLVDLVITHGGNNTVTETFYFGKRILVLPILWDQLDNGQRVEETGHGLQFNPYTVTEQELLGAIEFLLADEVLARRMTSISKRMQATNSQSAAADLVENVAVNNEPN